jgi:hypothetical protein
VDYSVSKAEAYKRFVISFLVEESVQDFLMLALQRHCEGAPSWVPDFSKNPQVQLDRHKENDVTFGSRCYYKLHSEDTLVVKGLVGDYICFVTTESDYYRFQTHGHFPCETRSPVRIGDILALISGCPEVVVLRDKGASFELLSIATPIPRRNVEGQKIAYTSWKIVNRRKRAEWEEAQRTRSPPGTVMEADPEDYLDDILIS